MRILPAGIRGSAVVAGAGALVLALAVAAESPVASAVGAEPRSVVSAPQDTVSFAEDVLPILRQRCAMCHGAEDDDGIRAEAGLNLLGYDQVMAGSEFGTVIEAGDPAKSYLLEMIVDGAMPEEGDPVPEEEIAIIRMWIEAGAPNN